MICKNKHREEDLKLLVDLGSGYTVGTPFRIEFSSGRIGRPLYVCEGDGSAEYTNCVKVDDTHVLCLLDNHNLNVGRLEYKLYLYVNDGQMPDGNLRLVSCDIAKFVDPTTGEEYCICLTNGVSDSLPISQMHISLLENIIKGEDADVEGCNQAIAAANEAAAAASNGEASRVAAEQQREAAMTAMVQTFSSDQATRSFNFNSFMSGCTGRFNQEMTKYDNLLDEKRQMIDDAVEEAETATQSANDAAEEATTAANNANDAAEEAIAAKNSANTAASGVNEAKEAANSAATAANTAATAANTAASTANAAAENASRLSGEVSELATELDKINVDFESNNLVITRRDGNTISLNVKGSDGVDGKGGLSFILDQQNVYIKLDSDGKLPSKKSTRIKATAYIGGVPANILKDLDINTSGCSPSPFEAPGAAVTPSSTLSALVMFNGSTIYSISDDAKIALTIYYLEGTDIKSAAINLPIIALKDGAQGPQGIQGEKGDDADIAGCNAAIASANSAASSANAAAQSAQQAAGSVNDLALEFSVLDSKVDGVKNIITDEAKALLETILKAAVYTSDQSANITAFLDGVIPYGGGGGGTTVYAPSITISGESATMTCRTSGAEIYYTLNGSTPSASSTKYTAAVALTESCTIKAIAIKDGVSSSVNTRNYTKGATYYSITNTLSHCSNSNSNTQIQQGEAYSATITAASGYNLDSVTCTMGGVSQTVTGGVISIASVSGNIVINATATEAPSYVTFADSEVERLCIEKWSSDGTGVTESDLAAATSLSSTDVFKSNTLITTFNEYDKFTGFTYVPMNAFDGCTALESIKIPNGVTGIRNAAFQNCSSLKAVVLNSGLTSIGPYCFKNCTSLESLSIPSSVQTIGNACFNGCSNLKTVNIPNGVTTLGSNFFNGCSSLDSIIIPTSVTSVGYMSFSGTKLTSISLQGVTTIDASAFYGISTLSSVELGSSIATINKFAFYLTGVTKVKIPSAQKVTFGDVQVFDINCKLYVGIEGQDNSALVAEYQADANCANYTIYDINDWS